MKLDYKGYIAIAVIFIIALVGIFYLWQAEGQKGDFAPKSIISVMSSSVLSPISPARSRTPTPFPDPRIIQSFMDKGQQLSQAGDYKGAIETFNQALALDPKLAVAYNERGNAYTSMGSYQEALIDYSKAIEIDPLYPYPYYNRGRIYSFLQKYDEAILDLQKSAELIPSEFGYRAYGNIGLIYHQQGEYDQALKAFEKSISYNNNKADVFYLRGETYTALQDYQAAISDYQAALERFPQYNLAYQSLGYAYFKEGQFSKASEVLNQSLGISPDNPTTYFYLMLVDIATNNFDNAKIQAAQANKLLNNLSQEERALILLRVSANLEILAKENPNTKEIQAIINILPITK
jgi:tetratricopeptide (TPR) repeat protein